MPWQPATKVLDGAGWHRSKDPFICDNLTVFYVPQYRRQMKPDEQICRYIVQTFRPTLPDRPYRVRPDIARLSVQA